MELVLVSILFLLVLSPSFNFTSVTPSLTFPYRLSSSPSHCMPHPHVSLSLSPPSPSLEHSFLSTLFHRETRAVKTCWAKSRSHTGLSQGVALWVCERVTNVWLASVEMCVVYQLCVCVCVCVCACACVCNDNPIWVWVQTLRQEHHWHAGGNSIVCPTSLTL